MRPSDALVVVCGVERAMLKRRHVCVGAYNILIMGASREHFGALHLDLNLTQDRYRSFQRSWHGYLPPSFYMDPISQLPDFNRHYHPIPCIAPSPVLVVDILSATSVSRRPPMQFRMIISDLFSEIEILVQRMMRVWLSS